MKHLVKNNLLVAFLLLISLVSNAQLQKFKVEIPSPAKFAIPDTIQSVTIMNRSASDEFQNFIADSLQVDFYRVDFDADKVLLDSLATDTAIQVLGNILYESERFDIVIPVDRYIPRYLSYQREPDPLIWEYVENICELYNTDALIVLENMAMRAVTDYSKHNEYWSDRYVHTHEATMNLYYRAHWRMYEPKNRKILADVIEQDTLYWSGYEMDINVLFAKLPSVKSALLETGIASAIDFAKFIAPEWNAKTRYYYQLKDNDIDVAINYAAEGDWPNALEIWLKYTEVGSKSNRSKVMLNVALAYEMVGDLDSAIEWAQKSKRVYYREVTNHYYKELQKQQKK